MRLGKMIAPPLAAFALICTVAAMRPCAAQSPAVASPEASAPAPAPEASSAAAPSPQSEKQIDLAAARAERKAIVNDNMKFTADESKAFWPVYDAYEAAMDKVEDRHIREIKDFAKHYDSLSDTDAKRKLDEVMAIAQARLNIQKAYVPKFRAAISQVNVTRFFQIDNKLRAMVQCQIAQMVPLAKQTAGGQGM
ncbi:MAG TPA: hypothetical protein VHY56_07430 [Candidatus Binataceae bacterium]|nr:hypothetical protein [Candidatus Binataceae bacterium]